jgi:hypothetical protein
MSRHAAEAPCYKCKVAGSIPNGPGVDSASNRNEYQESSWK